MSQYHLHLLCERNRSLIDSLDAAAAELRVEQAKLTRTLVGVETTRAHMIMQRTRYWRENDEMWCFLGGSK